MHYIELPPQEAPRAFSATRRPASLSEHLLAFLNVNNPTGFTEEEVPPAGAPTIGELVLQICEQEVLTVSRIKWWAKKIKRAANGKLKYTRAYDILAISYGYASGTNMSMEAKANAGLVSRRRNPNTVPKELFRIHQFRD